MKEKDAKVDFPDHQLIVYVEREDGSYGPVQTGSYLTANYLDDFWEKMEKFRQSLLDDLKKEKISPVKFYQGIHDFPNKELAMRVGISVRKLKSHQKMDGFKKIKTELLKKYSEVFDIPMANLFQVLVMGEVASSSLESNKLPQKITQTPTENPYIVNTKFDINK